jgi:hypothetical protein
MTPRSAKNKGARWQKKVAQYVSDLTGVPVEKDGDIEPRQMGQSGSDIIIRGRARELFPYGVECKNVEKLSIWNALDQANENCREGERPLMFFTRNRTNEYVAMEVETFMKIYKGYLNHV